MDDVKKQKPRKHKRKHKQKEEKISTSQNNDIIDLSKIKPEITAEYVNNALAKIVLEYILQRIENIIADGKRTSQVCLQGHLNPYTIYELERRKFEIDEDTCGEEIDICTKAECNLTIGW